MIAARVSQLMPGGEPPPPLATVRPPGAADFGALLCSADAEPLVVPGATAAVALAAPEPVPGVSAAVPAVAAESDAVALIAQITPTLLPASVPAPAAASLVPPAARGVPDIPASLSPGFAGRLAIVQPAQATADAPPDSATAPAATSSPAADAPEQPADEAAAMPAPAAAAAPLAGVAPPRPAAAVRHHPIAPDAGRSSGGVADPAVADEPPAADATPLPVVPDAVILSAAGALPSVAAAPLPAPAAAVGEPHPGAVRQPAAPGRTTATAAGPQELTAATPAAKRVAVPTAAEATPFATIQAAAAALPDAPVVGDMRGPAAAAEVLVTHHLDLAQDHAWLDRLAQDIARSADQTSLLRFALAPEHLGRLTVEIASRADGAAIRLTTETEQAQRIVADAQPRLIAEARAQGLRVADTQVDLDQRSGGQPHQQPHQHPAAAQQGAAGAGGQSGDRPRPGFQRTELRRSVSRTAAASAPAARDLYA